MLSWLISTSIRLRIVLLVLCGVLLAVGYQSIRQAPMDVFPEFAPPIVEIQTEAPGLSSEQVESLVTIPLENSLLGIRNVETVRSKSVLGLSQIVLILRHGSDLMEVRQVVQERLAGEARQLPAIVQPPTILQPLSSTSRVMKIGLWSEQLSQQDLSVLATWTIRPKLMAVPGVANVAIWGQRDKQYQVLVHPDRLRAHNVSLDAVMRTAADAAAIETGGFLDTPNQRLAVRHTTPISQPDDLGQTVVSYRGEAPVLLADVASHVGFGSPPPIGDAVINGGPGLLLIIEKQPEGNTLEVTRGVEEALRTLTPGLEGVHVDSTIFRPATFIERAMNNLTRALLIGGAFVIIVLIAFLFDWRSAAISLAAIPLSIVAAILVITSFGGTINTMVLAGLVIAIGELVDDAIIDVENILRRLRLNRALTNPKSPFRVVLHASVEVRGAVVYASLIVVLVLLPVFFLEGLAGAFFRPLALSYVLAILASLLVALTVTPALSYMLLTGRSADRPEAPLARLAKRLYQPGLEALVHRPYLALGVLAVAFATTALIAATLGQEFLPNFKETDFLMHFVEKPGTSVEAMQRVTTQASDELRAIPGVRNFGAHIGRAEAADEVVGPNFTELWISIETDVDYDATVKRINEVVRDYPGLYRDVQTYLRERIKEVLTGASATIVVRLYGPDLETLRDKARQVEAVMDDVPGVINLKVESQVLVGQVDVQLRPEAAQRYGLTPGHVRHAATVLLKGAKVGEIFEDQKRFDVFVWGVPAVRSDLSAIRALPIDTPSGVQVRLGDVADVAVVPTPNEIRRENASRRLDITCNVQGRDLSSVAEEIERQVAALDFPREYHPEFLGEYAAQRQSTRRLFALAGLALLGILLLLHMDFGAWRPTLLVFLTLPFALVGGVLAVRLVGGALSLGSLVGFITVLGITARNGIMMISHFRHLEFQEHQPFGISLVLRGAQERLMPVLMTVLTTGLALLPLAVTGNKPGQEIEFPMAIVILGGLATSTLLNLFLLPPLYARFGRRLRRPEKTAS